MEETQYLNLLSHIIDHGEERQDRTNVGTKSIFGAQLKFNLENGFPLLTTKRVSWKIVVSELLWFLSGSTDVSVLSNQGVKIWNKNAEHFHKTKHLFDENDLGPIYGFQWIHSGETYKGMNFKYEGINQIQTIIETIKTDQFNRRMILCAWSPKDIQSMALPPCHCLAHFDVSIDNKLSCHLFQRSADMGLGVPINIASYALLTHIIAHAASTPEKKFYPAHLFIL